MDNKEEYHDPDYQGTSTSVKSEPQNVSDEGKIEKIKNIIKREFSNELEIRENEIMLIEQRLTSSRKTLHRLRYTIVDKYYGEQKLQLTSSQIDDEIAAQSDPKSRAEVAALLRTGQKRLHPSVRKLLGKTTVGLDEIFKTREPRNKERKNYSAMIKRNYTIAADSTTSLRPSKGDPGEGDPVAPAVPPVPPAVVPRQMNPPPSNVLTLDVGTRNRTKQRYRIIIGNTSKYAPGASRADRSTHKWLLYVRPVAGGVGGEGGEPGVTPPLLTAVTVRLHHSYHPHHLVHIDKPPFHVSRRGWGEFPAKVELHFALPERNRPATVEHMIKLDRNFTGLQTLGAETIVDVWLYSTPEMLPYEFKDEEESIPPAASLPQIKMEVPEIEQPEEEIQDINYESDKQDNWLDFFTKESTLNVDEMIIIPTKTKTNDIVEDFLENDINKHIKQETDFEISNFSLNGPIKSEPDWSLNYNSIENPSEHIPSEILCPSTSPKKKIMKYMDPTTGKIYYLEVDRDLDLSKVQEIVINSKGNVQTAKISPTKPSTNGLKSVRKQKKVGVSLLKPEVQNLLKNETAFKTESKPTKSRNNSFTHLENDHCYLGPNWSFNTQIQDNPVLPCDRIVELSSVASVKKEPSLYNKLLSVISRFTSVRVAVSYMLKKIPVICESARDPDFLKHFPFVVENDERYWKLDFAKRRNIEWSRAKLINTLLHSNFAHTETIWRTKQILIYSRLHGYYPIRPEAIKINTENHTDWSNWTDTDIGYQGNGSRQSLSEYSTLTQFNKDYFTKDLSDTIELDSDEEVEVVADSPKRIKKEIALDSGSELELLPVGNDDDRLRFMFLERKCADIGIELRNEDVGSGYSYSAVHAVLLSAMRSFAEELIRDALAVTLASEREAPSVWVGASRADRSTHKWLLYVRPVAGGVGGEGGEPGATPPLLTAVTVRLHHSYHPHHLEHIDKPPFHVSRRGWGEFPAKVELHFALPERNRPATVEHMIKLDRNFTGLQTLGAETIVDVWLYSTPEMLPYEFKDEEEPIPPQQAYRRSKWKFQKLNSPKKKSKTLTMNQINRTTGLFSSPKNAP